MNGRWLSHWSKGGKTRLYYKSPYANEYAFRGSLGIFITQFVGQNSLNDIRIINDWKINIGDRFADHGHRLIEDIRRDMNQFAKDAFRKNLEEVRYAELEELAMKTTAKRRQSGAPGRKRNSHKTHKRSGGRHI